MVLPGQKGGTAARAKRNKTIILWAVRPVCVQWLTTSAIFLEANERNKMTEVLLR